VPLLGAVVQVALDAPALERARVEEAPPRVAQLALEMAGAHRDQRRLRRGRQQLGVVAEPRGGAHRAAVRSPGAGDARSPGPAYASAMTIGGALFLIAVGAILYFAVTAQVAGIDIQTVGLILMIVGIVGLALGLYLTARRPSGRPPGGL
jgi:hypothetical protein